MKRYIKFLAGISLLSLLTGCTSNNTATTGKTSGNVSNESVPDTVSKESVLNQATDGKQKSGKRVIIDQYGYEVELPEKIERIAIHRLLPLPSVYAVYKGGNVDGLVSMPPDSLIAAQNSILSKSAPDILNVSTDYYKGGELNMEELLKLKPDVVFYAGGDKERQQFENAGIPAVGFSTTADTSTIGVMEKWIEQMEDVLGEESKVNGIAEYAAETEKEILSRISDIPEKDRVKVLMIGHYSDTNFTLGGFGEYWTDATGSINVGKGAEGNINMEQVYAWNPDKIFVSTLSDFFPEDFYNNTTVEGADWSGVSAVINKEVYKFPLGMHRWWPPSTDAPLALWWIAKNTYPDKFKDISIEDKTKEYYKKFYDMELSDEDIDAILHPVKGVGRHYY